MNVRRVVTGDTAAGAAVIIDDEVEQITIGLMPATGWHRIWGSDLQPCLPADHRNPEGHQMFPPAGGFRFGILTLGPDDVALPADFDFDAGIAELREKVPGVLDTMEPDSPGMHTTDTVDYIIVLSGEASLELDNHETVLLRAGDTVVQNGTRHAWHNTSDQPCVMATTIIGATRRT